MTTNVKLEEHPDFETFNRMITEMMVMQIKEGKQVTDAEIAHDLTAFLVTHHERVHFGAVSHIASIVAALLARQFPDEERREIIDTPLQRTH